MGTDTQEEPEVPVLVSRGKLLAEQHIDWFLGAIRPLLVDNFEHGYKHGQEEAFAEVNETERQEREKWLMSRRIRQHRPR